MIGYCVPVLPKLASFRLRVAIPSQFLKMPHKFGVGDVTFFFKNGNPTLARSLKGPIVYDVVNPHFSDPDYRAMCELATVITCSSQAMVPLIKEATGRDAVVIPDPYENAEGEAKINGGVLWFGHQANIESLRPYADLPVEILTSDEWTLEREAEWLNRAGVVLLTGSNPGASSNRVVKALRAGRFVVAPEDCPESWKEFEPYIWIGDVHKGIHWAFENQEEACHKIRASQEYIVPRFNPQLIGSQWADLFASTLAADTNKKTAGSALTTP